MVFILHTRDGVYGLQAGVQDAVYTAPGKP